jgi:PPK2 family polyphosphate:nucleotide phosphotransferase
MLLDESLIPLEKFLVPPDTRVNLRDYDTAYKGETLSKKEATALLRKGTKHLAEMQDILFAHDKYRILIIFQAMDAAGKDSAVKHVLTGLNPSGVRVYSFKAPTAQELDHDYFWRHYQALPARGEVALHNRSHYENVLVTRVHPEYILNEKIPGVTTLEHVNEAFWQSRYEQINRFESNLHENGTIILKFFLNVSKKEQKKRFLARIDDPTKNWKFSMADMKERGFWDQYQIAYEHALSATSKSYAPWFVVPADDKWYTRLVIASVIYNQFMKLDLSYPTVTPKQKLVLEEAREMLTNKVNAD